MKTIKLSWIFLLSILFVNAQPPTIQWQKCFGGTNGEIGYAIRQLSDGGFLAFGTTISSDGDVTGNHSLNHADYWVVKLDSIGNLIWEKCYGGSSDDWGRSIVLTSDGGFVLCGYAASTDSDLTGLPMHGGFDYWVVKCDSFGSIQWSKNYGGLGSDLSYKIINSLDGGYVIVGFSNSEDYDVFGIHTSNNCGGGTCFDGWLVKIDSTGNLQWAKCFGGTWQDQINTLITTSDSGYVLAAMNGSDDGDATYVNGGVGVTGGNFDYWIVKINSYGAIEWQYSYGGSDNDKPFGIINTIDGGYLITGSARSVDYDADCNHQYLSTDAWTIKLDSTGNFQWKKCLGGSFNDEGETIIQLEDSGYLFLCNAGSADGDVIGNHSNNSDAWLVKLDQSGNLEWQKCFGGSYVEGCYDIQRTSDNGFIMCGAANSNDGDVSGNHGDYDLWVVKLSPLPAAVAEAQNPITDFSCHLNSGNDKLSINFFADEKEDVTVYLIEVTGRIITRQRLETNSGLNKKEISTGRLNQGIYLVRLETKNGTLTKKSVGF